MSVAHFDGHDNGPILYIDPNRTSAIDDIRSVVIYIFIITIFLSFFLILPGIRNSKFSTFVCIITSLVVTSIIVISLNGTTWHVGEAPISAPYKAFSRDRIQGDLGVRIGLQSVNISLRAHMYYILHATDGPMIMENTHKYSLLHQPLMMIMAPAPVITTSNSATTSSQREDQLSGADGSSSQKSLPVAATDEKSISDQTTSAAASTFIHSGQRHHQTSAVDNGLHDELITSRTLGDSIASDAELEVEEPFAGDTSHAAPSAAQLTGQSESTDGVPVISTRRIVSFDGQLAATNNRTNVRNKRQQAFVNRKAVHSSSPSPQTPFTIKRIPIDINYNERFHWIEPMQMRREYQQALERGLPYPILTVVEYLSQDDAGFSWSRQYRAAGYYTSMLLWVSASICVLMFCLHCAAPKYGIYAMQALGVLLLLTNLNYATLVPRGDQKLVIPFEGESLTFRFGWNFWLVLVGGCLSLTVGSVIVIIDQIFPNYIFTTVLDVDFDTMTQKTYNEKKYKILGKSRDSIANDDVTGSNHHKTMTPQSRPKLPPFIRELKRKSKEKRHVNGKHPTPENASNKKIISSALGVKLNPAYKLDESSENATISWYESSMEQDHSTSLATRDEQSQREGKLEASEKLRNNKHPNIPDEQAIKL